MKLFSRKERTPKLKLQCNQSGRLYSNLISFLMEIVRKTATKDVCVLCLISVYLIWSITKHCRFSHFPKQGTVCLYVQMKHFVSIFYFWNLRNFLLPFKFGLTFIASQLTKGAAGVVASASSVSGKKLVKPVFCWTAIHLFIYNIRQLQHSVLTQSLTQAGSEPECWLCKVNSSHYITLTATTAITYLFWFVAISW